MTILAILLPLALLISCGFVAAYLWATSKGQYDDLETPAHRIFLEDELERTKR
ncbi:MAG: cbb3-type cytochrome oxidase assembly protein CcoS [Bdellovibrionota bacterium]